METGDTASDRRESRQSTARSLKGGPALGENLTATGRLPGHTQVQTTARCARPSRASIRNAAARITGNIGGNLNTWTAQVTDEGSLTMHGTKPDSMECASAPTCSAPNEKLCGSGNATGRHSAAPPSTWRTPEKSQRAEFQVLAHRPCHHAVRNVVA